MIFNVDLLPSISGEYSDTSLDRVKEVNFETLNKFDKPKFSLVYKLGARLFGYYPSYIATALNDLQNELEMIANGEDHDLSSGGYPLLFVKPRGSSLGYFDVSEQDSNGGPVFVGDADCLQVTKSIEETLRTVTGVCLSLSKNGSFSS